MRLRLALHAGEVAQGSHDSVSHVRMLDAPEPKAAQKESKADLALITSDLIYRDAVSPNPAADPGVFHRIPVNVKTGAHDAWAWLRLWGDPIVGRTVSATAPTVDRVDPPLPFAGTGRGAAGDQVRAEHGKPPAPAENVLPARDRKSVV